MDQLSNMLSTIKNASMAKKEFVEIGHSATKEQVAKVLKEGGFLSEVKVYKEKDSVHKRLRLDIAYTEEGSARITDLKRISRPGRRIYMGSGDLKPVAANMGFMVVSTSRGVMSSLDAKKRKLGGEVICKVY